jgi:hypothetical protein
MSFFRCADFFGKIWQGKNESFDGDFKKRGNIPAALPGSRGLCYLPAENTCPACGKSGAGFYLNDEHRFFLFLLNRDRWLDSDNLDNLVDDGLLCPVITGPGEESVPDSFCRDGRAGAGTGGGPGNSSSGGGGYNFSNRVKMMCWKPSIFF